MKFKVNSVPFIILLHIKPHLECNFQPNKDDGEKIAYPQRSTVLEVVQTYNAQYTQSFV